MFCPLYDQSVLGAEGLSLAFRHIGSSLLWYCTQHSSEELLHEVIICVGYFTVNHPDNQVIVQSGRQPSVLQKLCQLPFQYFSHPHLIRVLFPTLISACYNNSHNKVILQQEMSCVLLATFIQVVLFSLCSFPMFSGLLPAVLPLSKRSVGFSPAVFSKKAGGVIELNSVL
ncbi:hypothetical protein GOODEAATRI_001354 [Goodea atripinnis]|uniref:Uncharacterized protein n=1 Tax=Goodea atripinnis TaxID=208336 RepID=A0ABV0NTF9_9TELE